MAETKKYKVKSGFTHYIHTEDGLRQAHAGEVVELTEAQFSAFADRFEDPSAKPEPKPAPAAPEPPPAGNPVPPSTTPVPVVTPPPAPSGIPPSTVAKA